MKLRISDKASILIGIPLAFELVFMVVLAWLLQEAEHSAQEEARAKQVISETNMITDLFYQQVTISSTYIVTRSPLIEDRLNTNLQKIHEEMQLIKTMTKGHPREEAAVAALEPNVNRGIAFFNKVNNQVREGRTLSKKLQIELQTVAEDFLPAIRNLSSEVSFSKSMESDANLNLRVKQMLIAGAVINVAIAAILVTFFSWSTTKRLSILMDNAKRLGERRSLNEPVKGSDEIQELDLVIHEMAEKLNTLTRRERAILENAGDVICTIDALGVFTSANKATVEGWGYEPEELVGTHIAQIVSPDTSELTLSSMEQAKDEKTTVSFENQMKHRDESNIYALWSVFWSDDEASFFCVVHDITARREIERLKQEFVAVVSHDLRTPLTSIDMSLALLAMGAKGELTAPVLHEVERSEKNIKRLIQLINDLLDLEKMGSGKWELFIEPVVLSDIVERSIDSVKAIADNKDITIFSPAEDVAFEGDRDRLVQVLVNYLSNALKFSPEASTIEISGKSDGKWLEVRVIDHGPGIPEEYKNSIFDKFQQVKNKETRKKGGTGLGLAICEAIVAEHGGTVGVDSEIGAGSQFWLRIPLERN